MNQNYAIGIDLGSQNIKIILVKFSDEKKNLPKIINKMSFPSAGISFGYINNKKLLLDALKNALNSFQKINKIEIQNVFIAIDGFGLKSKIIKISQTFNNKIEIQESDLIKIQEKSERILKKNNDDKVINYEIINYIIDDYEYLDTPENLQAKKIEANIFFLTYPQNNIQNIENVIEKINLEISAYVTAPNALSDFLLQNIDKKTGCLLVDYGAEKTSIFFIEKNKPQYFDVFKIGSKKITELIAISEEVSFNEAEKLKISKIKTSKINQIIKKELTILTDEIKNNFKKNHKEEMLFPGGIILTGGGSNINLIENIFKKEFRLPVKKLENHILHSGVDYSIAYSITLTKEDYKSKDAVLFNLILKEI
ncbi:MAG: rod shape-determining protein [Candidatus Pacebacteria bacterium]|nr:rod shape-determining protein [Candidatus Paceibacterota bacterium]